MNTKRILVVDDSPAVIKRLTLIIESLGYEVVGTAVNGLEAIARSRELQPDAITMDIQMPEMDGLEATTHILRDSPDRPSSSSPPTARKRPCSRPSASVPNTSSANPSTRKGWPRF